MNPIKILLAIVLAIITMSGALATHYWYDDYTTARQVNYNIGGLSNSGVRGTAITYTYPQIGYNYPTSVGYGGYNAYGAGYGYSSHYGSNYGRYAYNPYSYRGSYNYRPYSTGISNYGYNSYRNYGSYGGYGGYGHYGSGNIVRGASQPTLHDGYSQQYIGYNRYY